MIHQSSRVLQSASYLACRLALIFAAGLVMLVLEGDTGRSWHRSRGRINRPRRRLRPGASRPTTRGIGCSWTSRPASPGSSPGSNATAIGPCSRLWGWRGSASRRPDRPSWRPVRRLPPPPHQSVGGGLYPDRIGRLSGSSLAQIIAAPQGCSLSQMRN